jgi:alpha-beta hydrolase superfamily lysophospholipase
VEELTIEAKDGLLLSAAFFPVEKPRALVQIIYGLKEHKERYYWFCQWLNSLKIACIIADTRGHGKSVNDKYHLGYIDSNSLLIDDELRITDFIKVKYPRVPLTIFAHSFGTVIARMYLERHDNEIVNLIMTGTVCYNPVINGMEAMYKTLIIHDGPDGKRLSMFFDQNWTNWICNNPKIIEELKSSQYWLNFKYSNISWRTIGRGILRLHKKANYIYQNPNLQIWSLTGSQDPCPGGKLGLDDSLNTLRIIGYKYVFSQIFPNMKHEVIHEVNNQPVLDKIKAIIIGKDKKI